MSAALPKPYTVFDYENQRWVFGEEAREVRIAQLRAELEILRGPDAAAYVAMMRKVTK